MKTKLLTSMALMLAVSAVKAQYWAGTVNNNYIPRVTNSGTMLFGNSALSDNGTSLTTANAHLTFSTTTAVINWGGGSGDLIFRRLGTLGQYGSGFSTLMTISYNGNVGIGATGAQKLHVHNGAMYVSGTNSYGGPMILLGGNATTPSEWGIESTTTGLNFWRPSPATNQGNYFMFLRNSDGNVGIKTDNPTADLTVNGNMLVGDPATISLPSGYKLYVETGILTEKVKVAVASSGSWSDFVFDENYNMPSLKEVEEYIKAHKHLPGIPSAEEVVKDGLDLGSMDAKLLQKIEELTLYVISLEKEITNLKKQ